MMNILIWRYKNMIKKHANGYYSLTFNFRLISTIDFCRSRGRRDIAMHDADNGGKPNPDFCQDFHICCFWYDYRKLDCGFYGDDFMA